MDFQKIFDTGIELVMTKGPKILLAIFILIIGMWLINKSVKAVGKLMKKRNVDSSLLGFFKSMISIVLKILLAISVLSMLGIATTSFIALLGAAGLAIGMALSGTLQNFAGGVMILIFKPFKVGDFISTQGYEGEVVEIQIFHTVLNTLEHKTVIIANAPVSSGTLVNYTKKPYRRVDITFGIGYGDDIDKARKVIMNVIKEEPKILNEPESPFVQIVELGSSSVDFTVRVWALNEHYWDVFFYLNEYVKKAFDKNGVSIPFPQQDVHIYQNKA